MKDWDDEIHRALAHPIRRRMLECLQENNLTFRGLVKRVSIANHGKLGFHLRALKGLVEVDPTTGKYRLTDRGRLASELVWDIRFIIERGGRDLAHEPTRYVRRLKFGDHAVLYYDTENVKREITYSFLESGLPKGEAVVYVVSERKLDSERREIQRYGISGDYFRNGAFTIMSAHEWYLKKGNAQAKTIIANWETLLKEKQKAGFSGVRAAGEMEVFFNYAKAKELFEYEAALGRQLAFDLCALCLYEVNRLDEKQVIQLNKYHGHEIFKDIALRTTEIHSLRNDTDSLGCSYQQCAKKTDASMSEDLDAVRIKIVKSILDISPKAREFVKKYVYMQVAKRKKCVKTIAES